MNLVQRTYIAIDLKSFFASVECVERGLDPLTTNLVVADASRTEKTICLAVTPSLKAYGIGGRARLFEAVLAEAARYTEQNPSLDDQQCTELNCRVNLLLDCLEEHPMVVFTLFEEDGRKNADGFISFFKNFRTLGFLLHAP